MKPNIETDAFLSEEIETERTWLKRNLKKKKSTSGQSCF